MDNKYKLFQSQVIGKFIEKEDAANYAQCMDLAFAWCDFLGIPRETIRHLYAYQAFTQPNDVTRKYFDIIPNSPSAVPVVGDIPVFGTKVGVAGHICIETGKSDQINLVTLDQNWGSDKRVHEITHRNYEGVLGWLHPKDQSTLTPREVKIKEWCNGADNDSVFRSKVRDILK